MYIVFWDFFPGFEDLTAVRNNVFDDVHVKQYLPYTKHSTLDDTTYLTVDSKVTIIYYTTKINPKTNILNKPQATSHGEITNSLYISHLV